MARKRVVRALLPLSAKPRFVGSDRKAEKLADTLRAAALTQQQDEPRAFYALREIAAQFRLPVSLVAAAYRQLETEGLLTRLRGSKTLLNARGTGRRLFVHRVIAIPIAVSSFLARPKLRTFFMQACCQLRERNFVAAGVFYDTAEAKPDLLALRIRQCNADSVLWYMPDRCAREASLLLSDYGIAVVAICDGGVATPKCRYLVDRESALALVVRDWMREGIAMSRILRLTNRSAADEHRIAEVLDSEALARQTFALAEEELSHSVQSLCGATKTAYVMTDSAAAVIAFRAPHILSRLMAEQRVALFDGPITLPFASVPRVEADVIAVDWAEFATKFTLDLLNGCAFVPAAAGIIRATPHLGAPLSRFADVI